MISDGVDCLFPRFVLCNGVMRVGCVWYGATQDTMPCVIDGIWRGWHDWRTWEVEESWITGRKVKDQITAWVS